MTSDLSPNDPELVVIDDLVSLFKRDIGVYEGLAANLRTIVETRPLKDLYHSMKWRVKDPLHLRDKLLRKAKECRLKGMPFDVSAANIFEKINDLAGIRLLHLHTSEFSRINAALCELLEENRYSILEGPEAKTWDDEYREYFGSIGVSAVVSKRMYTSVHYVVASNTRTKRTAEIQVRTLAEELWGEVDHSINYPQASQKLACREQIKVLARVTSSCTRLVDAIFATHREGDESDANPRDNDGHDN